MNNHRFILDKKGNPIVEPDLMKWARWLEESKDRILRQETIKGKFISTVFLGLDYNFYGTPPILYETMVFDETKHSIEKYGTSRYYTRKEALKGHRDMVKRIKNERN